MVDVSNFESEELFGEEVSFEKSPIEEEVENVNERGLEFAQSLVFTEYNDNSLHLFRYAFVIQTFSLEPEENPPCC